MPWHRILLRRASNWSFPLSIVCLRQAQHTFFDPDSWKYSKPFVASGGLPPLFHGPGSEPEASHHFCVAQRIIGVDHKLPIHRFVWRFGESSLPCFAPQQTLSQQQPRYPSLVIANLRGRCELLKIHTIRGWWVPVFYAWKALAWFPPQNPLYWCHPRTKKLGCARSSKVVGQVELPSSDSPCSQ